MRPILSPEPGYWLMPAVRGGPLMPARIWWVHTTREPGQEDNLMERSRFLAAEIAGEPVDMDDVWLRRGEPIDEKEYKFRIADLLWATTHAPKEAIAKPRQRVNLRELPIPFT